MNRCARPSTARRGADPKEEGDISCLPCLSMATAGRYRNNCAEASRVVATQTGQSYDAIPETTGKRWWRHSQLARHPVTLRADVVSQQLHAQLLPAQQHMPEI